MMNRALISAALTAAVLCSGLWMQIARGETIQLGSAPTDPAKAGFSMFVSTERVGNEGFQPITLRFQAIGQSFNRQRVLRILFRPRTQYATAIDFQFSCDVTVPQGVKTYEESILVPHFYRWEDCSVQIIEDGRRWGKTQSQLTIPPAVKDWGQFVSVGILVPRDADTSTDAWAQFPDVRSLVTILGDGPVPESTDVRLNNKASRDLVETINYGRVRFRILDEDALQTSWIGYSQLDLILAPLPTLRRIEVEQPAELDAIRRWVSTGAEVWAYGAKLDPATDSDSWLSGPLAAENQQWNFTGSPQRGLATNETNDTSPIQYQPWNYGSYSSNYNYGSGAQSRKAVYEKLTKANHPMTQTVSRAELVKQVDFMPYGIGRVVMIDDPDPFPGTFQLWQTLESDRLQWNVRQGIEYASGNDSYWAWLMSAVGQPPVIMFVVLNALFVLVMGPVFYFGLRRRSRLYLLYFLAPTMALLATSGLFLYAFLSDGFSNRSRIRQLTWVDGRHGSGASSTRSAAVTPIVDQSRQTYYTVVDSQQGLQFSDDTLVLPVHHSEMMGRYSYYPASDRQSGDYLIRDTGDRRIYGGDFLPTRTQVHVLTTTPTMSTMSTIPIEVTVDAGTVRLTNRLDQPLQRIRVCDPDGQYWSAENVAAGATVELTLTKTRGYSDIVLSTLNPNSADMPKPYRNRMSLSDQTSMERQFETFAGSPPRNSFIAITDVEPDQFALRNCVPDQCVRLIGGYLP